MTTALAIAVAALKEIATAAPDEAPEPENYDDTESAYNNGNDVACWEAGQVAKDALKKMGLAEDDRFIGGLLP